LRGIEIIPGSGELQEAPVMAVKEIGEKYRLDYLLAKSVYESVDWLLQFSVHGFVSIRTAPGKVAVSCQPGLLPR